MANTKHTIRFDERAEAIVRSISADKSLSFNAAVNYLIREFEQMRRELRATQKVANHVS